MHEYKWLIKLCWMLRSLTFKTWSSNLTMDVTVSLYSYLVLVLKMGKEFSSQENIQTRAFTNSTNRLLIKFDILLYDKHPEVTVTLLMIGLPSYIRVSYRIQVVDSNFHLPWKAFRIRSNRYLNIFTKTKKRKEAPCSSASVSSGSLPGSSDILFEQHINRDNVLCAVCHIAETIFSERYLGDLSKESYFCAAL